MHLGFDSEIFQKINNTVFTKYNANKQILKTDKLSYVAHCERSHKAVNFSSSNKKKITFVYNIQDCVILRKFNKIQ